jgi:uncharacterized membrane protein
VALHLVLAEQPNSKEVMRAAVALVALLTSRVVFLRAQQVVPALFSRLRLFQLQVRMVSLVSQPTLLAHLVWRWLKVQYPAQQNQQPLFL